MQETISRPTTWIGENILQSSNVNYVLSNFSYLRVTSLEMRFIVVIIKGLLYGSSSLIVMHFIIGNVYWKGDALMPAPPPPSYELKTQLIRLEIRCYSCFCGSQFRKEQSFML